MYQVIIVVHVLLGLGIVGLVLMQQGKGADAGAAFGSGGSGSVFGAQGSASFLSRTTAIFATLFFTTSLTLAALSGKQVKHVDIMDTVEMSAHSVDVPAASKTPVPAVSSVTDKPAAILPAIATPVVKAEAPAPAVVDSAAKVDENKKAVEQKPTEKKQNSDKSGKAEAKNDKKSSDKSEKKADKAKKHKSDKKDQTSDKK